MITSQPVVVVATTLFHLQAGQALAFAVYLESEHLADSLRGQRVLDCAVLRNAPSEGVFLDQEQLRQAAPEAVLWLQEQQCYRLPGCRMTQQEEAVISILHSGGFQVGHWDDLGYVVVVASAIEVSTVLELCDYPCLLQFELPGASYLDIVVHGTTS